MNFIYQNKEYFFKRYPKTANRSLQAWNAADELMLDYIMQTPYASQTTVLINDRFGFLSCMLPHLNPFGIIEYKSQEKAIRNNFERNKLKYDAKRFTDPLAPLPSSVEQAVIQMPKSTGLFRFYLERLTPVLSDTGLVVCGFMTRHFTKEWLEIASLYFEEIEQSRARKKARLLILKKKKQTLPGAFPLEEIRLDDKVFRQYPGVFSAGHIDFASRFLLEHLHVKNDEKRVLDLACGNGILAYAVQQQQPDVRLHLMDDSFLAIESAKLNISGSRVKFHYNDTLDGVKDAFFDLIVSNPPFHFGYETNIEVSIALFKQARRCLRPGGRLLLVANRHLNYRTHLQKLFKKAAHTAVTDKFEIIECTA